VPETTERDLLTGIPTEPYTPTFETGEIAVLTDPEPELGPPPAQPVEVPGNGQYLKRWLFALVVAGVWMVAAAAGWGLYYWWYHSLDKTPSVFVVMVFVTVCTVGGLLIAMVEDKPLISGLAVAVMSAPLGAVAGAAVLHGVYFCEWASRCFAGVLPY
jgi:hypothetical protein